MKSKEQKIMMKLISFCRYNHMEKMFLDATNKTEDSAMNLQKMITG